MSIVIFEPKEKETYYLKLFETNNDHLKGTTLALCDEDGGIILGGKIITIYSDGTAGLHPNIPKEYGLKLTDNGMIDLRKEYEA